jgi:hypothetical protein
MSTDATRGRIEARVVHTARYGPQRRRATVVYPVRHPIFLPSRPETTLYMLQRRRALPLRR